MERALPAGAIEVVRCGCGCALWYYSNAQREIAEIVAALLAVVHPTLLDSLLWHPKPQTARQPPGVTATSKRTREPVHRRKDT